MSGPLHGIRVLEIGQFLSAPRCGRLLAEQGADVIKLEPPTGEPLRMLLTLVGAERSLAVVNAGKRGLTLNLKSEEGATLFKALVKKVDVVVENLAPGALERMGLGFEALKREKPDIILCSISGFGQDGPHSERLAFDIIAQATSGVMHGAGQPSRPPAIFFGDLVSGAYAAMGVGFALLHRERTGEGQHVDVAMQDVMYAQHFHAHSQRALGDREGDIAEVLGRSMDNLISSPEAPLPFWSVYKATDGYVALVALTDGQWKRLMRAIDREDLVDDPRFSNFVTRVQNAEAGLTLLAEWVGTRSTENVIAVLGEGGVPCGRVATTEQVNEDPHLKARGMLWQVGEDDDAVGIPGVTPKTLGSAPGDKAHPTLGEHTDSLLREWLHLSDAKLDALRSAGTI